jgi:hypothetical protein
MRFAFPALHAWRSLALLPGLTVLGCAQPRLPDPKLVAARYAQAALHADSGQIYALLSSEAQRDFGRQGTEKLVQQSKAELRLQAAALQKPENHVQAAAEIRFDDGESARFELEDGAFRLSSLGTLPSRAHSPAEALADFRRALARRSYAALLGVLSLETRGALEGDMKSLVDGLENPETLEVKVSGDNAQVVVPGGHQVKLRRDSGVWRIQDFD